jgi:hypothetical protein
MSTKEPTGTMPYTILATPNNPKLKTNSPNQPKWE